MWKSCGNFAVGLNTSRNRSTYNRSESNHFICFVYVQVATRQAYGTALAKLGDACPRIIGLDGDTKNSTFSEKLLKKHPDQFIECFIAEQNLIGVAVGLQCRDRTIPFAR